MSTPAWASRFGLTEHDLNDIQSLITSGRIPVGEYLSWARDHYEIPVLNDEYFAIAADPVFWNAVREEFAWTPAFFPLTEWDGVLLIACVEAPNFHFPSQIPHAFVLASPEALAKRFLELEPHYVAPMATPASVVVEKVVTTAPKSVRGEVTADNLPPAPDVDLNEVDGLVFKFDNALDPHEISVPDGLAVRDVGQPIPSTPDGLEDFSGFINGDAPEIGSAVSAKPAARSTLVATPMSVATPAAAAMPMELATPKLPPGPPMPVVEASNKMAEMTPEMPPIPRQVQTTRPPVEGQGPFSGGSSLGTLATAAIGQITNYFENAVVLVPVSGGLRPVKWSELLLAVKPQNPDVISLDQPSIFRVATRTALPYHGYVVANETNGAFFNAFHRGVVPKHVTLMPVLNGGQLTAVLMGLTMNEIDYKATLTIMEKIASDFSTAFERIRPILANAAA